MTFDWNKFLVDNFFPFLLYFNTNADHQFKTISNLLGNWENSVKLKPFSSSVFCKQKFLLEKTIFFPSFYSVYTKHFLNFVGTKVTKSFWIVSKKSHIYAHFGFRPFCYLSCICCFISIDICLISNFMKMSNGLLLQLYQCT